jgi:hypothetical protein
MSKLDDTIVTLLLGETAGGAFGRKQAAIGTGASAEATATLVGLPSSLEGFDDASAKVAEKQKKVEEAEANLKAAEEAVPEGQDPTTEQQAAIDKRKEELETAKKDLEAALKLLQSAANTAAETAGEVKQLIAGGGLNQPLNPEVAAVLAEIQEEFLVDDFTENYVSACLVEFALADRYVSRAGRLFDSLLQRVQTTRTAELEGRHKGLQGNEMSALTAQRTAAERDLNDFMNRFQTYQFLVDKDSPLSDVDKSLELFHDFQEEWRRNPDFDDVNYISAANIGRASMLAEFCLKELPGYMLEARNQFHDYRMRRIGLKAQVDLGVTGARVRSAEAERWKQFKSALESCGTLPEDKKAKCQDVVLSGKLPDPVPLPEDDGTATAPAQPAAPSQPGG